jgi:hypothetical protein
MKWESVKKESAIEFRRLTGVKKETFEKMVGILEGARQKKGANGGRKPKLNIEEMLLMSLEYLREYRTYFHISRSYGLSESNAYKIICWVEATLIRSKLFSLPGRKALLKSEVEYEVVLVDASESPIQRPKKSRNTFIQGKRSGILSKAKLL